MTGILILVSLIGLYWIIGKLGRKASQRINLSMDSHLESIIRNSINGHFNQSIVQNVSISLIGTVYDEPMEYSSQGNVWLVGVLIKFGEIHEEFSMLTNDPTERELEKIANKIIKCIEVSQERMIISSC